MCHRSASFLKGMFCPPSRSLPLCSGTPGVVRVSVVLARTSSRVSRCERRPRAHTDSVARETSQRATRVDTFLAVLRGAQHVPRASCVVPSIWKRPLLILKAPDCCHQRLLADVRFGAAVKRTAVQALLYLQLFLARCSLLFCCTALAQRANGCLSRSLGTPSVRYGQREAATAGSSMFWDGQRCWRNGCVTLLQGLVSSIAMM
jgi:hypothetical protein